MPFVWNQSTLCPYSCNKLQSAAQISTWWQRIPANWIVWHLINHYKIASISVLMNLRGPVLPFIAANSNGNNYTSSSGGRMAIEKKKYHKGQWQTKHREHPKLLTRTHKHKHTRHTQGSRCDEMWCRMRIWMKCWSLLLGYLWFLSFYLLSMSMCIFHIYKNTFFCRLWYFCVIGLAGVAWWLGTLLRIIKSSA